MKRLLILPITLLISLFILASCSSPSKISTPKYADKKFITALSQGLENRWKLGDEYDKIKDPSTAQTKEYYHKFVQAELENISPLKDKKFKDSKLQALVIQYYNALEDSKKSINSLDSLDGAKAWSAAYDTRTKLLVQFKESYHLKVSKKYQSYLDNLEKDGQKAQQTDEVKTKVTAMTNAINFKYIPEQYDDTYKKYQATVENTTGVNLSSFSGQVNLINANGVTVDSTYINTDNWKAGAKVLFEFTTDKTFSKTVITPEYQVAGN
ncbi:FxLYD domain-containing protein [Lactococcus protaetiae]|uniref:DUF5105 domain-containing protein n=1 Tax=Lactococcus protaetiae TaxID=2592653 RepID=A0A514Z6L2_9LACT|nr:FxLYD domain-containing protein [Lactococcus protaetiae]QDK70193.1 hypothetical protein FLP15_02095 [Lactococcus protaetiae]